MDISSRYNGVQKRDKFENVLDELQKDSVISSWSYTEEIDEEQVGKKGWFQGYWTKLNVLILPTDIVVKENQKKMMIDSNRFVNEEIIERMNQISHENSISEDLFFSQDFSLNELAPTLEIEDSIEIPSKVTSEITSSLPKTEQQAFHFGPEKELALSPETMREMMDSQNMSIRQTAEEIGISHSTLSRYLRKENKRQNNKNDEKMLNWIKEKSKRQNSNSN
ncbi:Uncharacterised protein [Chlamydia trachomatis]|nr:Uncharacterised protein [Chlamydia trachomatis]